MAKVRKPEDVMFAGRLFDSRTLSWEDPRGVRAAVPHERMPQRNENGGFDLGEVFYAQSHMQYLDRVPASERTLNMTTGARA